MKPSRAVVWVLTWLVVVAVGSTLVWAVISRAGEQVVLSSDPLVATTGPGSPMSLYPSHSPLRSSASPRASVPSPTPPASPPPASPVLPSPPVSSAPPPAAVVRRTWQGPGGMVVAQCVGRAISRVSLVPDDGFAVELKDDGPEELEVEFEGREEDGHSEVRASCVDGVPVFRIEVDHG